MNGGSSSNFRFPIPNSRFLFPLLCIGLMFTGVNADDSVNYDTAWTFVYDGGVYKTASGKLVSIYDNFADIKVFPNGDCVCVGSSADTTSKEGILAIKFDSQGKTIWKKLLNAKTSAPYIGGSVAFAKNGDLLIGGLRYAGPWLLRTDSVANIKWAYWYYDSLNSKSILAGGGV